MIIRYCNLCMQEINAFGDIAEEFFKFICILYSVKRIPILMELEKNPYITLVRFLEMKGYIVSKEIENAWLIKPRCFNEERIDDILYYNFCCSKCHPKEALK
jgi:hypothetical protein